METVVTSFPSCRDDGGVEYVVFLGRAPVGLGDLVDYKHKDRLIGQRYVAFRKVHKLSDIEREDIQRLSPSLREKNLLWSSLESEYNMEVPGHYEITILGLAKSDYYVDEPVGECKSYSLQDYFSMSDDLEEYEEEFGDLQSYEKIPRGRRNED